MANSKVCVEVDLPADEGRSSLTPGWEVRIKIGDIYFSYEDRLSRDEKDKAIAIAKRVAEALHIDFRLIE